MGQKWYQTIDLVGTKTDVQTIPEIVYGETDERSKFLTLWGGLKIFFKIDTDVLMNKLSNLAEETTIRIDI